MFDSAKLKLQRADYHISELERQFAAFVAEKPHRFIVQSDLNTGHLGIRIRFVKEVPPAFALIIGDAIHNLRSSLDHAIWELVGIDHGTQDRHLKFPTGDTRISFEASCNGIKTPGQWAKDAIKSTEAFIEGRGMDLYNLNILDNADKHIIVAPILRATGVPKFTAVWPDGRRIEMQREVFMGGAGEFIPIMGIAPGGSIELDDDVECPPSIFFRHPDVAIASPAIPTLKRFAQRVCEAINILERAIPH
jgi:hypothetical protein